jgi:hypothetical protein
MTLIPEAGGGVLSDEVLEESGTKATGSFEIESGPSLLKSSIKNVKRRPRPARPNARQA